MNRKLQIVLKITERCNINCSYCYVFNSHNDIYKENPKRLNVNEKINLRNFIERIARDGAYDSVAISFHGGEPLLYPINDFESICKELRNILGIPIFLSIQTNGILLNEGWIDLLLKYNIFLGISLDGPEEINDVHRVDKKGHGTFNRVMDGIGNLEIHKLSDNSPINPFYICVLQEKAKYNNLYHFFRHTLGAKKFNILLPDFSHDDFKLDPMQFYQPLKDVIQEWLSEGDPSIEIRFIDELISSINNPKENHDSTTDIITISSSGRVCANDEIMNQIPELFQLNLFIANATYEQLNQLILSRQSIKEIPTDCHSCILKNACRGSGFSSTLAHRYSKDNHFNNKSIYCELYKSLYAFTIKFITDSGVKIDDVIKKLQGE